MSDQLKDYHIRPRFKTHHNLKPDQIENCISEAFKKDQKGIYGTVLEGHATIFVPQQDQHYWSPQLSLSFEKDEAGSVLRGLFGPRPEVWTMFVLFYSLIGFAVLVISVIGYSQWSLGNSGAILWWVPILSLVFLTLYLVAYFGQKLGRKQMRILKEFIEENLNLSLDQ